MPLPGSEGTVTSLIATLRGTLLAETDSGVVEFEGALPAQCFPPGYACLVHCGDTVRYCGSARATESGGGVMGAICREEVPGGTDRYGGVTHPSGP